ncbi:MAG: STAS domain-containing protein [Rhizobacter sp.]|nr:STAS domain-containing protein [Rhizobacter sp.]
MLLLPATLTADEAQDTLRLLTQGLRAQAQEDAVIDASALQQFDTSALAVLLECQRHAQAFGKSFAIQRPPAALVALAKLYGVHTLLMPEAVPASVQ